MPHQGMNRISFQDNLQGGFSNKLASGVMPSPLPSPLFLNLGCGNDIRDGYINIDLFGDDPRVVGMDIRKIDLIDDCADGILASDVLEHFSHRETPSLLKEWQRVLKPGGELLIRCPSLELQTKAYISGKWNADIASYMIFGGQTNPGDYHCTAFDEQSVRRHLELAGFDVLSVEHHDLPQDKGFINLNMTVRAVKRVIQVETKPVRRKVIENQIGFEFDSKNEAAFNNITEEKSTEDSPTKFGGLDFTLDDELPQADAAQIPNETTKLKPAENPPFINIVWEGSQFLYHSLALINRELCLQIINSEAAELTIVPYEKDMFEASDDDSKKLLSKDIRHKNQSAEDMAKLPYAWIRHQWPPMFTPPKGAKWIVMQPWEYTTVPVSFVENLKDADEIWTPSTFSRKSFVDSGFDFDKVQVIPNGINPHKFKPFGKKYPLAGAKAFKFLFVGGTIFRKGIDVLLKAYKKAFSADDNVSLIIKDMGGDSFYKGQNARETIEELQQNENTPHIMYIHDNLSEEDMAALYRSCDVFVSPYRGEGFSLPTLEAMASGLPVIVTKGGATDDFVSEDFAWKIPSKLRSIGKQIDDIELTDEAFVLEPDQEKLAELLRSVCVNPFDVFSKGLLASAEARTNWTWKKSALKMFARLDTHYGTEMAKTAENKIEDFRDAALLLADADIAFLAGDTKKAFDLYSEAQQADDIETNYILYAMHMKAYILIEDGLFDQAKEILDAVEDLHVKHPDTMYMTSRIYSKQEKWTEALEILTVLMENWIQYKYLSSVGYALDTLLTDTAEGLMKLSDPENALKLYTEALKFNSNNYLACYGAGRCFADAGAVEEARNMFEWAVDINPDFQPAVEALQELD